MNSINVSRNYRLSDAELCVLASKLIGFMTRDLSDLAQFGVTAQSISAFEVLINSFESFPTDDYFIGKIVTATSIKNDLFFQIKETIRNMATRMELCYGAKSGTYRSLGISGMNKFDESKLLLKSRDMSSTVSEHLTDLVAYGLTQDELNNWRDLNNSCEGAMREQSKAIAERDNNTEARITLGNTLYERIIYFCEIGKRTYAKSSPARYDDYVIYEKQPGGLVAPAAFWFDYANRTIWWMAVPNATSYQLEIFDGTEYVEIYAGENDHYPFVPPDGMSKYRVRARNDGGFGPFSEVLEQWYFAVLPKVTNIKITRDEFIPTSCVVSWDPVPTVVEYRVYQSIDEIGQHAAHWLYLGIVPDTNRDCILALGKRNYFKIEANNLVQTSVSAPAYIDV